MKRFKLDDIDHKHPFKTPEGYFEQLNTEILTRKSELNKEKSPIWVPRVQWALASTFIAILAIIFVINISGQVDSYEEYLADVSDEEIMAYLASTDITELEILEMVDEETIFDFEEMNSLDDIELDDEALDEIYLKYGITDEMTEI